MIKTLGISLVFLLIVGFSTNSQAQDSTAVNTIPIDTTVVDTSFSSQSTSESTPKPKPEPLTVWMYQRILNATEATNDSLLRWEIHPNWGDWYARQYETISYRQGTIGRLDGFLIGTYEPRFQQSVWNGITLNDPVSGFFNQNFVPHHKLSSVHFQNRLDHTTQISYKNWYIKEPITQLNFDESKFKYRNLEFSFARNFTEKTNLELSFWDRRDGDAFERSDIVGSQIFGRLNHQFNNKLLLKVLYLRNEFDREESFGYNIIDINTFPFDRFTTSAVVGSGQSNSVNALMSASVHFRKDKESDEHWMIGIHRKRDDQNLTYNTDTTAYEIKNYGLRTAKSYDLGALNLQINAGLNQYNVEGRSSLSIEDWQQIDFNSEATYTISNAIQLGGNASFVQREDLNAIQYGAQLKLQPSSKLLFQLDGSLGDKLPDIQALYWNSRLYRGNQQLDNESITSLQAKLVIGSDNGFKLGLNGGIRLIENGILLGADSTFANSGDYEVLTAGAFTELNANHFEGFVSGTMTMFQSDETDTRAQAVNNFDATYLIRGGAFIKGPVYNSAAYLKAGLIGTFSPQIVNSFSYVPDLGYWSLINSSQQNPSYFRLDAEISARIRSIILLIRNENLLDGLGQSGYFESVGYPMPPRRLILGIRVLFKN